MKIDSHQHFWKLDRGDYDWPTPDLPPIYRDFQPADLHPLLTQTGIDATILVQATDSVAETSYLLALAAAHDWILGVVGWVDMEAKNAVAQIERFAQDPKFVGVRPMIQTLEDDAWMLRPSLAPVIECLVSANLCFDALVLPKHLPHLRRFLDRYPDLAVVIDHGAKPEIANGRIEPWATEMASIAHSSSALCKMSGLVTEAKPDWVAEDILPYANHILDCFGPERVMFGSDWPVLNLAGDYSQWAAFTLELCKALTPGAQRQIMGQTAYNFYMRRSKA